MKGNIASALIKIVYGLTTVTLSNLLSKTAFKLHLHLDLKEKLTVEDKLQNTAMHQTKFAFVYLRRVCFGPDAPEREHLYVKEVEHHLKSPGRPFIVC